MSWNKARWVLLIGCLILAASTVPGWTASSGDLIEDEALDGDEGAATAHRTQTDTADRQPTFRPKSEKFQFQAEVNRLMDIIINSLYSNKDIFLRELISNASDALDKIRFLALTDKSQLGEGDQSQLEIRIKVDKERRILSIKDTGVGMTKKDLINNLGTIAKSGTSAFLEQMQKGGDVNLIGQFGVGFYSVYLVADHVEVISKHNDDKQYIWESNAGGEYAISEDTEGEPLGRGTQINIHLKEETQEYADEAKLKELVGKYSEFINFPIYLWSSKEVEKEVPADEDDAETDADSDSAEDVADDDEVSDDAEDEESSDDEGDKTKKVKETVWDWEVLNDNKAIWLRNPAEVTEDEYSSFFQALSKTQGTPLATSHFSAEGDVEFKALMFIPPTAPYDFMNNYYQNAASLKLYVRRVFISDDFEDLIPRYLSFLKGIVDSDTLPLSVSRETLQQHSALKTIKKKLVRKALDMIKKLSEADRAINGEQSADSEVDREDPELKANADKWATLWKEFGKALKLGVIEDVQNRQRLAKLIRFYTSKSPDKLTSLEDYVARMKSEQKDIYYLAGESIKELQGSPFLEQLLAKDYEVIFFTDPVDEYLMQNLQDYDDIKFQNASKDDLKLADKDQKKENKKLKEKFKELVKWWQGALEDDSVEAVRLSTRLATSPCVVVTSKYGWTANMERIMRAQALGDAEKQAYMKGRRILEINPHHPLIQELKARQEADKDSKATASLAKLLYETALLESGFQLNDAKAFNTRVYSLVKDALDLKGELSVPPQLEKEQEAQDVDDSAELSDDVDSSAGMDEQIHKDEL